MKNRSNYLSEIKYSKKLKSMIVYIALFGLWIITAFYVSKWTPVIFVLQFLMALMTIAIGLYIPNERDKVLKEFKVASVGYLLWLFIVYFVLDFTAKTIGEEIALINNIFVITIFMVPIGYFGFVGKKALHVLGIGKTKKETAEYYSKHGNDGFM